MPDPAVGPPFDSEGNVIPLPADPGTHYDQDQVNDMEREDRERAVGPPSISEQDNLINKQGEDQ